MAASISSSVSSLGTPGDLIVYSLEDLKVYDFKKFRNKLSDFSFENKPPIPRGRLENADCVATKDLLVDAYGKEGALDAVIEVLKQIDLHGPAGDLQERRGQCAKMNTTSHVNKLTELRNQYMESVKEDFQRIKEHNARGGESVSLQTKYISLLMTIGFPERAAKEDEIQQHCRNYTLYSLPLTSFHDNQTTLETLFDPDKDGSIPKVVVLHGPAGIGKTWTSRKIMQGWASGNFYQGKFDFVFYLSCRELNTITGKISIVQLLSRTSSLQSSGDLEFILTNHGNQGRILFVIDGFDEFEWTLEEEIKTCHELHEETHKDTLLGSLLKKQLLKQSSLLITTRSLAQEKLYKFINDSRYIEVKGFSYEDRWKYIHDAFRNEAEKIIQVLKGNDILFTMCNFPIMCWILCTVLRQEINKGSNLLKYKTTTPIYLLYLEGLMMYHGRSQSVLTFLKKLCSLANDGVLNRKILFQEEDLERHGLSVSEVESVFLNENVFHVSIKSQTWYSFPHKTLQEFMAALYYVLEDGEEEAASEARKEASLPEICKGGSLPELYIKYPHLSVAVRFLFGFLYDKQISEFSESTSCKISLRVRSAVEEWITGDTARTALRGWITGNMDSSVVGEWITTVHFYNNNVDIISCLYETQDDNLIRRAMPNPPYLNVDNIWSLVQLNKNGDGMKHVCYCLKLCQCPLMLTIRGNLMYCENHETYSSLLHWCQWLHFVECYFPRRQKRKAPLEHGTELSASVYNNDYDEQGTKFYYLEHYNNFSYSDHEPLDLSWLINPHSRIQVMSFIRCHLSSLCCDDLHSVLITNRSLIKLDLTCNNLEDSGVKCLCEGLKDPRCTLQELNLSNCNCTNVCCDDLRSALLTNQSLTKLDLSENKIQDSGVKRLREALRDTHCTLQELSFLRCHLSSLCCDDLHSVLITNRSLIKLDLTWNNLEDSGVKCLCEGLKDTRCTLQELNLSNCNFTNVCCDDLRSALLTNQSLTKLDLSENKIQDSGVKRLCEALRDARCTLQELRLDGCWGKSSCCEDLYSVINTSKHLTYINISMLHYGCVTADSGASIWFELLRSAGFCVENDCFGNRAGLRLACARPSPGKRWTVQWS